MYSEVEGVEVKYFCVLQKSNSKAKDCISPIHFRDESGIVQEKY